MRKITASSLQVDEKQILREKRIYLPVISSVPSSHRDSVSRRVCEGDTTGDGSNIRNDNEVNSNVYLVHPQGHDVEGVQRGLER